MKTRTIFTSFALALVVLFAGCEKDDFVEKDGVCPVVVSTSPANGEANVTLNRSITATFNEAMNPATITQASFTLHGTFETPGTVTYNGLTATFTPSSPMAANATYTGKITRAARDPWGNALQVAYEWTFNTGSGLSPLVVSSNPDDNATGVVLNQVVAATFNMAMDPLTINTSTFRLSNGSTPVTGSVALNGSTAYFTPAANLLPGTDYTATVSTGAKNTTGAPLAVDHVWNFTTGTTLAPYVLSNDPLDNAINVSLGKVIGVTFSEPMNSATINSSTFSMKNGAVLISGTISYSGSTALFTPDVDLLPNATYTVTMTAGVQNPGNVSLSGDHVWTFQTGGMSSANKPDMKSAGRFGILAGTGIANDAGFSEIHDMDVGISPGLRSSISGFPPAIVVNGAIYCSDDLLPTGTAAMLIQAKQDLTDVYLFCEGAVLPAPATVSGDIGGMTLAPGIYKSTSTLMIQSGSLTLDAQGDANAVWIFQVAAGFTTVGGAGGDVILTGGAQADNVFWQSGSSVTIGDFTSFKGNVLALTSITMNDGAVAQSRMLARNGAVVMTSSNTITKP